MFTVYSQKNDNVEIQNANATLEMTKRRMEQAKDDLGRAHQRQEKTKTLLASQKALDWDTVTAWMPDDKLSPLQMVLESTPLRQVDQDPAKVSVLKTRHFDVVLQEPVIPCNQMYSGRCWMFAGLNIMRRVLIRKHQLKPDFELSQSYLFFWHYFEQYNDMLNLFYYAKDMAVVERLEYLEKPLHDGGNWITFRRLAHKYGVVPKKAYRESWPSSHSSEMNTVLCNLLRNDIKKCGSMNDDSAFHTFRDARLQNLLRILCVCMGRPPVNGFNCAADTMLKKHIDISGTPHKLFTMLDRDICIDHHIQLIDDPRTSQGWSTTQHQSLQTIPELSYNVCDMSKMAAAVLLSIRHGVGVWFACNMNEDVSQPWQGMADGLYRPDMFITAAKNDGSIDENPLKMSKHERMDWGRARCNHAMLLVGVEVSKTGVPVSFKIENSWGGTGHGKGFYKMTAAWFKEHVYTVVVHRNFAEYVGIDIPPVPESPKVNPYYDFFG